MKVKYLADENLRRAIVLGVRRREPSVSFSQAHEAGAAGRHDLAVLEIAAEQNSILVSHDVRTIPAHFQDFISQRRSPGAFLIPQRLPVGTAIEQLLLIWLASEAEEWVNQIRFLPL